MTEEQIDLLICLIECKIAAREQVLHGDGVSQEAEAGYQTICEMLYATTEKGQP